MFKDVIISGLWASSTATIVLPFMVFEPKYVTVLSVVGRNSTEADSTTYRINATWVNGSVLCLVSQPAVELAGPLVLNNPAIDNPMSKFELNGVRSGDSLVINKSTFSGTATISAVGSFGLTLRFSDE